MLLTPRFRHASPEQRFVGEAASDLASFSHEFRGWTTATARQRCSRCATPSSVRTSPTGLCWPSTSTPRSSPGGCAPDAAIIASRSTPPTASDATTASGYRTDRSGGPR